MFMTISCANYIDCSTFLYRTKDSDRNGHKIFAECNEESWDDELEKRMVGKNSNRIFESMKEMAFFGRFYVIFNISITFFPIMKNKLLPQSHNLFMKAEIFLVPEAWTWLF